MKGFQSLSVDELLDGKRILLTGGTGFLGQVFLSNILRNVPNVAKVLVMVRPTDQQTPESRFSQLLDSPLFDDLCNSSGDLREDVRSKVECVPADLTSTNFGLSEVGMGVLAQRIDHIVNCAALGDLNASFEDALKSNTIAVCNLIKLSKCDNVPLLQVSTCFTSGSSQGHIKEELHYPQKRAMPTLSNGLVDVVGLLGAYKHKIAQIKASNLPQRLKHRKLIQMGRKEAQKHGWQDAYSYTKWLAEHLLVNSIGDRNLTIIRPSVMESTLDTPIPGWVGEQRMVDRLLLNYLNGEKSIIPTTEFHVLDMIPVDRVANALLLAMAEQQAVPGKPWSIYQCCSSSENPITIGDALGMVQSEIKQSDIRYRALVKSDRSGDIEYLSSKAFKLTLFRSKLVRKALATLERLNPLSRLSSSKKKPTTSQTGFYYSQLVAPYLSQDAVFSNANLHQLTERFIKSDQLRYPAHGRLDWETYLKSVHLDGLLRYGDRMKQQSKQSNVSRAETAA